MSAKETAKEVLSYEDIKDMILDENFVTKKVAKVRFNDEVKGKDEKGKNIYVYPQHFFTLLISYEGLSFAEYFRRGGNREEIVSWQNSHRKLGEDWLKANDGKEFTIKVVERTKNSGIPKPEKLKADIRAEILKGTVSVEDFEAIIAEAKKAKGGTVVD